MVKQEFGGAWTRAKLDSLRKYLEAYKTALKSQPFTLIYVDAFAGTGSIKVNKPKTGSTDHELTLPELTDPEAYLQSEDHDVEQFLTGSARIALNIASPFDNYIFIEQNAKKCHELAKLKDEYPRLSARIEIHEADANTFLTKWCSETNWRSTRAVVFLDPYGMQVKWSLLDAIAKTKAIDLWLLVPIGIGLNRVLTRNDYPSKEWESRITDFLGTEEWKMSFYRSKIQTGLFDDGTEVEKKIDIDGLNLYIIKRLKDIFTGVAKNPMILRNSRNSPLFLLCFACGNPNGKIIALPIAEYLLKE